jgi:hypothetical protein
MMLSSTWQLWFEFEVYLFIFNKFHKCNNIEVLSQDPINKRRSNSFILTNIALRFEPCVLNLIANIELIFDLYVFNLIWK